MPCVDSGVLGSVRDTSDCRSHVAVSVSLLVRSASGGKGSSSDISSKRSKIELMFPGSVRSVEGNGDVDPDVTVAVWRVCDEVVEASLDEMESTNGSPPGIRSSDPSVDSVLCIKC